MPGCLPLGIEAGTEYAEARIKLETGDAVTFVSDGVVEARNRTGELFGFERTARVSTGGAQQIAQAAREFGQEDDITVVRLQAVDSEQ
jgi:serine phosphatase RsbU (regulator of sigma subunit)